MKCYRCSQTVRSKRYVAHLRKHHADDPSIEVEIEDITENGLGLSLEEIKRAISRYADDEEGLVHLTGYIDILRDKFRDIDADE